MKKIVSGSQNTHIDTTLASFIPVQGRNDMVENFPKIIWFVWFQGLEAAPEIIKVCYESWVNKNPGWEVRFYDLAMADEFLFAETGSTFNDIPLVKKSNIFRLNALRKYGGVWADATTLCAQPLDEWLGDYLNTGFFVLRDPSKNKILSSWFMASTPGCKLTERYCYEHTRFWLINKFPDKESAIGKVCKKIVQKYAKSSPGRTKVWFSPFFIRVLKIYPYTILHYHLNYLISEDEELRHIFKNSKYMAAYPAQQLRRCRQAGMSIEETRKILSLKKSPIYKLSWKDKLYPQNGVPHREYIRGIGL